MPKRKVSSASARGTAAVQRGPRTVRQALKLSQRELAELVGAHEMTVSKWERGVAEPTEFQARVLEVLDVAAKRGKPLPAHLRRGRPMKLLAHLLGQAFEKPDLNVMALSATNRLPGVVVSVDRGEVMSKVVIEVAPDVRVGSVITTDSVKRLRLRPGSHAMAVIKATEVMVAAQPEHEHEDEFLPEE